MSCRRYHRYPKLLPGPPGVHAHSSRSSCEVRHIHVHIQLATMSSNRQYQRNTMNKLKQACIKGDLIEVRNYMHIVKQRFFPFKELEKTLKPLVYWTTLEGQLEVLKELIEKHGCDPHYTTERGHTLLYAACARGHANVARYLAHVHQVDPNQRNRFHVTPLIAASNNGHLEAMVMLIDEFRCDPTIVNIKGEGLLHKACGNGHLELVECLITKYGLNPEARSDLRETPLHFACGNGHLPVAQYLIEMCKCETNVVNCLLSTPLHSACRNGRTEVVCYLVEKQNCNATLTDDSGSTPLHLACRYQRKDVVKALVNSSKVDPNIATLGGEIPIRMVSDQDTIRLLLKNRAKPIGSVTDIFKLFKEKPHDSPIHAIMIGCSRVEKITLVQALQTSLYASHVGSLNSTNTVSGKIPCVSTIELNSKDCGQVILYDFVGQPDSSRHGVLPDIPSILSVPLILLVTNLSKGLDEVKRYTTT